jgi:hypothetical protein
MVLVLDKFHSKKKASVQVTAKTGFMTGGRKNNGGDMKECVPIQLCWSLFCFVLFAFYREW